MPKKEISNQMFFVFIQSRYGCKRKKGLFFFDLQNIKRPYSSKPRTDLDNKKETRGTDGDIHRIFFLLSQQVGMMST